MAVLSLLETLHGWFSAADLVFIYSSLYYKYDAGVVQILALHLGYHCFTGKKLCVQRYFFTVSYSANVECYETMKKN